MHGALPANLRHGLAAAATEPVLARPGADLRGVTQDRVSLGIPFEHERAQAPPAATGDLAGTGQLKQKHWLAIEVADAVLAQHLQFLALEPVALEQRALFPDQKALRAVGHGQAGGDLRVEYCGRPAC